MLIHIEWEAGMGFKTVPETLWATTLVAIGERIFHGGLHVILAAWNKLTPQAGLDNLPCTA